MSDRAVSKVVLNGVTLIDVTQDTVTTNTLLNGESATGADGQKVNGSIPSKTVSNLMKSGATVTVPAGYYGTDASLTIDSGSIVIPSTITSIQPTINFDSETGTVLSTVSGNANIVSSFSPGYISETNTGTITVNGNNTLLIPIYTGALTSESDSPGNLTDAEWIARFEPYKLQKTETDDIKAVITGAALSFTDSPTNGTTLRIHLFTARNALNNYQVYVNNTLTDMSTITYTSGTYRFDIGHIKANRFDQFQIIEIKNQNNETEALYQACLFSYAYSMMQNSSASTTLKDWIKTWYPFCMTAHAQFD